jgi:hypothetical protein
MWGLKRLSPSSPEMEMRHVLVMYGLQNCIQQFVNFYSSPIVNTTYCLQITWSLL